ncbi:hypothetical protein [Planctobacterium marinum]|uniref:Uncharacterized protein n=1 Tax=Planctobacterium marinum TaxID=1631968 RepID=A0AA48I614_9ALTE|nr:hypothetical protein MACH26_20910 [Planctobacterium marinum]
MFNKKLQVEKVEMVKKIIRKYDYGNYEATHKECVELGLNVNRPALDRLGEKLQMLDSQAKSKSKLLFDEVDASDDKEPAIQLSPEPPTAMDVSSNVSSGEYGQFSNRADEITYELGALRIRENELLKELSVIRKKTSN